MASNTAIPALAGILPVSCRPENLMRSSALPTLALAILMLAAGAFGTWYMLAHEPESPRAPSVAVEDIKPVVEKPEAKPDTPIDRAKDTSADTPIAPQPENPAPKPVGTDRPAPADVAPANPRGLPDKDLNPEQLKEALKKLEDDLKAGRMRLPPMVEGDDFENVFNGPKVAFAATVSGTVTDTTGAPIPGASVYGEFSETLEQGDGNNRRVSIAIARSSESDRGTPLATTDASGSFTAQINRQVPEKVSVSISLSAGAESFADSKSQRVALKNGDTKDGIKLVLRGAGSVTGRVVDGSGRGVEGVKVTIGSNDSGFVIMGSDGEGEMPGRGASKSAVTDGSGNFTVTGLAEGRYKPRLRATGWRQVSGPTEVTVKPSVETRCAADFVMAAAAGVKIKVIGPEGKPVQGFASVRFKEGNTQVKSMSSMVGSEGLISLNDTPVGTFTVEVRVHGFKPQTVNATIVDGQVADLGSITVEVATETDEDEGIYFPGD